MSKPASTESEASLGLIAVSRESLKVLEQVGVEAEKIGLSRIASGSVAFTMESLPAVKRKLHEAIVKDDGTDPERLPAVANAYANIIKSEASLFKVLGTIPASNSGDGTKRARKAFATAAPTAPIDVTPNK